MSPKRPKRRSDKYRVRYQEIISEVRAWHGTPHRFKTFDIRKVNSGEGAQAYGWGLYFASVREVAEFYRRKLSQFTYRGKTIRSNQERLRSAVFQLVMNDGDKEMAKRCDSSVADLIDQIDYNDIGFKGGGIFEVELPDDSLFMNFDLPFRQQPLPVRKAFKNLPEYIDPQFQTTLARYVKTVISDNDTGKVCYHHVSNFFRNEMRVRNDFGDEYKETSLLMLKAGIAGLRYLDGESREGQEGTYNYVVFDHSLIHIVQHHPA